MKISYEKYFNKYGYIYGISMGMENLHAVKFTSLEDAQFWVNDRPRGYDVKNRWLCTKAETRGLKVLLYKWGNEVCQ